MAEKDKWYKVSLRISGDAFNVEEIVSILGLQPTFQGKKGELMGGKPGRARYETNLFGFSLDKSSHIPFEEQIPELLDLIDTKINAFKRILSTQGMEGELILAFSSGNGQGGAFISSTVLKRITDLGLQLIIDLYPPEGYEQERAGTNA